MWLLTPHHTTFHNVSELPYGNPPSPSEWLPSCACLVVRSNGTVSTHLAPSSGGRRSRIVSPAAANAHRSKDHIRNCSRKKMGLLTNNHWVEDRAPMCVEDGRDDDQSCKGYAERATDIVGDGDGIPRKDPNGHPGYHPFIMHDTPGSIRLRVAFPEETATGTRIHCNCNYFEEQWRLHRTNCVRGGHARGPMYPGTGPSHRPLLTIEGAGWETTPCNGREWMWTGSQSTAR